ncbi:hypothetical protein K9M78_05730 [Candidatus Bipolaricaulota bacterium]|nr:hypothetical protein [Candidatus Bipolaricaulota bacterium]
MGFILGTVLLLVLLVVAARYLYTKLWLERSDNYYKCKHCGKHYEDHPYYCPHCGEVVDAGRN